MGECSLPREQSEWLETSIVKGKTRWAGCKFTCNHELVVPSQFQLKQSAE